MEPISRGKDSEGGALVPLHEVEQSEIARLPNEEMASEIIRLRTLLKGIQIGASVAASQPPPPAPTPQAITFNANLDPKTSSRKPWKELSLRCSYAECNKPILVSRELYTGRASEEALGYRLCSTDCRKPIAVHCGCLEAMAVERGHARFEYGGSCPCGCTICLSIKPREFSVKLGFPSVRVSTLAKGLYHLSIAPLIGYVLLMILLWLSGNTHRTSYGGRRAYIADEEGFEVWNNDSVIMSWLTGFLVYRLLYLMYSCFKLCWRGVKKFTSLPVLLTRIFRRIKHVPASLV